jgi:hypothetical protein
LLLLEFLAESAPEIAEDAVDESLLGLDVAPLVFPVLHVGVVSILDHVLSAVELELAGDQRPAAPLSLNQFEELKVLLQRPVLLVELWIQVVAPLLAALLEGLETGAFGLHEKDEGNTAPVISLP